MTGLSVSKFVELLKKYHSNVRDVEVYFDEHFKTKYGYAIVIKQIRINDDLDSNDGERLHAEDIKKKFPNLKHVYVKRMDNTNDPSLLWIDGTLFTACKYPYYKHQIN